jgi:putative transposase
MSGHPLIRKTCQANDIPWDAHELTFSCYKRQAFLSKDRTRLYFAEAVERAKASHGFDVWAYVIMPEHVHMLVWCPEEQYSTSAILLAIKQSVARRAVGYLRQHNPLGLARLATGQKHTPYRFWQDGRGYDRNIRVGKALYNCIDYIHRNPVRRELVSQPEDWQWSSYRDWQDLGAGPIPIDKKSLLWAIS